MSTKQFDQQQKLSIVEHGQKIGFKAAAKVAGVHYTSVYDWKRQLDALGKDVFLSHKARHPGRGEKQISKEQEEAVVSTFKAHPSFGPGQVRNQLRRCGKTISIRTVRKIMQANGYKAARPKEKDCSCTRFEAERPLELAQMDILELYINKLKLYLILLIDDYSRFILGFALLDKTSVDAVIDLVQRAIDRYGKMQELLTDRGFVFYSWRGINRFEHYLENERIDHTHARPHHPQTLGKVEALNRRIKSELFGQSKFATLAQAQAALEQWADHYNYKRAHQGLGGLLVPAERLHGKSQKVLDELAKGCDVTGAESCLERSIVNLVLAQDGAITLYLLGRPIVIQGSCHV
jgi:putative transposase